MATKRLWFVLPLDIQQDPNFPARGPEMDVAEAPQPARRDINRIRGLGIDAAPQPANPNQPRLNAGYVFRIAANSRKEFTEACTSEELAFDEARNRAGKEPKRPFGVFSCIGVVETMDAPVIEKEFNDAGELRIKTKGA